MQPECHALDSMRKLTYGLARILRLLIGFQHESPGGSTPGSHSFDLMSGNFIPSMHAPGLSILRPSGIYLGIQICILKMTQDIGASAIAVHRVIDETQRDTRVKLRKGRKATRLDAARRQMIVGSPRLPMISSFDASTPGFFIHPTSYT